MTSTNSSLRVNGHCHSPREATFSACHVFHSNPLLRVNLIHTFLRQGLLVMSSHYNTNHKNNLPAPPAPRRRTVGLPIVTLVRYGMLTPSASRVPTPVPTTPPGAQQGLGLQGVVATPTTNGPPQGQPRTQQSSSKATTSAGAGSQRRRA